MARGFFETVRIRRGGAGKYALAERLRRELSPVRTSLRAATPVRTGRLRRSVRMRVTTNRSGISVSLGWFGVPYARYVEARYGIVARHASNLRQIIRRVLQRHRTSRRA